MLYNHMDDPAKTISQREAKQSIQSPHKPDYFTYHNNHMLSAKRTATPVNQQIFANLTEMCKHYRYKPAKKEMCANNNGEQNNFRKKKTTFKINNQ